MLKLTDPIEVVISQIGDMDRRGCMRELNTVPHLRLDFTAEFLRRQTTEELRHILLAAHQQARRHRRSA